LEEYEHFGFYQPTHPWLGTRSRGRSQRGCEREASRLNAHTKLRLLMMTDEDLTGLAEVMARHSGKSIEKIRKELDEVIAQYQATADTWVSDVFGTPSNSRSGC